MRYLIGCIVMLNCWSAIISKISITNVNPTNLKVGATSLVIFTLQMAKDDSFDGALLSLVQDPFVATPCEEIMNVGLTISCLVTLPSNGIFVVKYNDNLQTPLKITGDFVGISKITPLKTFKTAEESLQSIVLTFDGLPLPQKIEYELTVNTPSPQTKTKFVANCEDYKTNDKLCRMSFHLTDLVPCSFYFDGRNVADGKTLDIFSALDDDFTVDPPFIKQNLTEQSILLKFSKDPTYLKDLIFFNTQKVECNIENNNLNCSVLAKTEGSISIYKAGVNSGKTLNVIKVEDDILFDVYSTFIRLPLITSLISIYFFF